MTLPMKAIVWTVILVILEGIIFSKIAGSGLLLHGSFISRAFVILVISITGFVIVNFFYVPKIASTDKKAVLITGCDTGFGHWLAKRLESLGFTVFAGCLNSESEEVQELISENGRIHILQLNVTSEEQVMECMNRVISILREEEKYLWAVVNNAGIAKVGFIEMLPMASFEEIFQVNTMGTVRVSKTFLPLLRGHGRIVNVTSLSSRISYPYFSAYSMSKFATLAFSDALRREMMPFKVKVATVEPGRYRTSIIDSAKNIKKFCDLWEKAPQHVRAAYGSDFVEACSRCLGEHLDDARKNVDEVIDTIVEAICAVAPKAHYIPSEQISWRYSIFAMLPVKMLDRIALKHLFPSSISPESFTEKKEK